MCDVPTRGGQAAGFDGAWLTYGLVFMKRSVLPPCRGDDDSRRARVGRSSGRPPAARDDELKSSTQREANRPPPPHRWHAWLRRGVRPAEFVVHLKMVIETNPTVPDWIKSDQGVSSSKRDSCFMKQPSRKLKLRTMRPLIDHHLLNYMLMNRTIY